MSTTNHIKTEGHFTTFEAISMIVGKQYRYRHYRRAVSCHEEQHVRRGMDGAYRVLRKCNFTFDYCRIVL